MIQISLWILSDGGETIVTLTQISHLWQWTIYVSPVSYGSISMTPLYPSVTTLHRFNG